MKFIVLLLMCTPLVTVCQRYALIDRKLKVPILYTDSVTVEQVNKGFFPIENKSIDTLIVNLLYLKDVLDVRQRSKMKSFELRSGNIVIRTNKVPFAYGDRYSSVMESYSSGLTAQLTLIDQSVKNKKSADHLDDILRYFKSNKSFFTEPNEIHPKMYNVVVVTD